MYAPPRPAPTISSSKNSINYQRINQLPQNYSQPYDNKFNQYDFKLPFSSHNSSLLPESSFNQPKRSTIQQFQEPQSDSTLINNHRFFFNSKSNKNNINSNTQATITNQSIYKSSQEYRTNRSPTSMHQIRNSANHPPVLPAILTAKTKKATADIQPTSTPVSSFTMPTAPQSSGASSLIPSPPASATSNSAIPTFSFNFPSK